jgi:ATPase, P-type (transporting), HAD superfamily, subfamily IC
MGGHILKGNPVTVIKNEELINIDQDDLRRNDIVVLQAGDIVPADLRLVEAARLEVDEFELTGEIMPVIKGAAADGDSLLYMGTRIIKGTGKAIVVATGDQTEYGEILKPIWEPNKTYQFSIIQKKYFIPVLMLLPAWIMSLKQSQNRIWITVFYSLLALIFLLSQNNGLVNYLLIKKEIKKLKRSQIQIGDETALELMNQIDILCFDKTGVLTTRQMTVKNIYWIDRAVNVEYELNKKNTPHILKIACALCHDVLFLERMDLANPVDKALISFAEKMGMNIEEMARRSKRIYDMPFNSENRYMACGYKLNNTEIYYFVKGDPDVIIGMCDSYITENGMKKRVDYNFWLFNQSNIEFMNQKGGIVIALAYASAIFNKSPQRFTFLCLLQLENSLQPGVDAIIRKMNEKGLKCKMLTGDRAETAVKVGKDCGMMQNSAAHLVGRIIERMALPEIASQAEYCAVFARLLPSQKGLIIRLLQDKGHCIAMIGDGPNDGIALKVADIGISFLENSSPIARRLSKILIHDLDDLLRIIEGANRIKRIAGYLKWLRIILLPASLFGIYLWVLCSMNVKP